MNITYGAPAAAAAAELPALSAELDQHAAAVRDILEFGVAESGGVVLSVLLAAYARGLLDQAAVDMPGSAAVAPLSWHDAGWLDLRLAAVCQYAALP
ncbi:DUF6401 family natural product biosynthesis protein [Nocardia rhizosphaerae]|uniref:DUF6401 family natural product biosynthesis protein n=1 Tax=Nocardia rhizosphaerae TaxID=1691571 RepID=A0ABV8L4S8_9NOCA